MKLAKDLIEHTFVGEQYFVRFEKAALLGLKSDPPVERSEKHSGLIFELNEDALSGFIRTDPTFDLEIIDNILSRIV